MSENDWRRPYVAGAFDWGGRLSVTLDRKASSRFGYQIRMELMFERAEPTGPGMIDEFCTDLGLDPSINVTEKEDRGERFRVRLSKREDIQEFLDAVYPFLASRHEQAEIMLEDLFPALEEGRHTESKEGFVEVVSILDRVHEAGKGHGRRELDAETIAEELGVSL